MKIHLKYFIIPSHLLQLDISSKNEVDANLFTCTVIPSPRSKTFGVDNNRDRSHSYDSTNQIPIHIDSSHKGTRA